MSAVLTRETFETSRLLEYFSEKELRQQIGMEPQYWPVAILRELIDNALDASESTTAPVIEIATGNDYIVVADNGPGIPPETVERSLDYLVRVSNKAYYISPTRGQMGNALKVIWAAPFVATGTGHIEVESRGVRHVVDVTLDRIAQQPDISHRTGPSGVKTGTLVKIQWRDSTRLLREPETDSYNSVPTAADLVAGFASFNPHATFELDGRRFEATATDWRKWRPNQPTSAHWYTPETLRDLIAGYISAGTEKTVREFVAEFRGLSGTAKQKAVTAGWARSRLEEFVASGDIAIDLVGKLLRRMQEASKAPPAALLGVIGKEHLTAWMVSQGVAAESIRYVKKAGIDGLPCVLEVAFGVNNNDDTPRRIVTGLNWSPVIGGDPDPTLRSVIADARLDRHDPVTLLVHIAKPRFQFADRGKTRIAL